MELKLVREVGTDTSSSVGRPGTRLEIDGRHRLVIGCEVNLNSLAVIVTDLAGRERYHLRRPLSIIAAEPASVIDELAKLCQEAIDQLSPIGGKGPPVQAIGIAVPGSVDLEINRVSNAPNLRDWSELALVEAMRRDLGLPDAAIIVDNDASFAALAEYWTGPHAGTTDFVHVTGDVGIGGGAVIDGHLLLSSGGRAGAVGHMVVDPTGPACSCGRRGCWESFIGLNAFLSSLGLSSIDDRGPEACLRPIVSRARLGDPVVLDALTSLGSMLGLGAANLINLLGSDVVILGGYFAEIGEWILPAARTVLRERVLVATARDDLIVTSTLGFNAAALGAALQAGNQVLSDPILLHLT
jgi:predicted NBD/HSP70 family sugar kinase